MCLCSPLEQLGQVVTFIRFCHNYADMASALEGTGDLRCHSSHH